MGLKSGTFMVSRQGKMETIPYTHGSDSRVRVVLVDADGSVLGATMAGGHWVAKRKDAVADSSEWTTLRYYLWISLRCCGQPLDKRCLWDC